MNIWTNRIEGKILKLWLHWSRNSPYRNNSEMFARKSFSSCKTWSIAVMNQICPSDTHSLSENEDKLKEKWRFSSKQVCIQVFLYFFHSPTQKQTHTHTHTHTLTHSKTHTHTHSPTQNTHTYSATRKYTLIHTHPHKPHTHSKMHTHTH